MNDKGLIEQAAILQKRLESAPEVQTPEESNANWAEWKNLYSMRETIQEHQVYEAEMDLEIEEEKDAQRRPISVEDIQTGAFAGKARFTIVSKKTRTRFTYCVVRAPKADREIYFVGVLNSPNNENGYAYIGTIFGKNSFRHTAKSRISETAPSVVAFSWFIKNLGRPDMDKLISIYHENRCLRCGRILTVPESVSSHYGPECIQLADHGTPRGVQF